jgi:hypothetical protein
MSSPDAMTALELGIRYYRLIAPVWDLSLEGERDTLRLLAREAISLALLHVLASEILLVTFASPSRCFAWGHDLLAGGPLRLSGTAATARPPIPLDSREIVWFEATLVGSVR